jgi:hypothetical protein
VRGGGKLVGSPCGWDWELAVHSSLRGTGGVWTGPREASVGRVSYYTPLGWLLFSDCPHLSSPWGPFPQADCPEGQMWGPAQEVTGKWLRFWRPSSDLGRRGIPGLRPTLGSLLPRGSGHGLSPTAPSLSPPCPPSSFREGRYIRLGSPAGLVGTLGGTRSCFHGDEQATPPVLQVP